uniref:NADH-ubiquinone oxidoreductase chain 6 n=1 Tax=Thaumetopoea pityocampa TaxID=208016 RepID=A0A7S4XKQ3_THAPI|nr:NADH dehydrogenase subunit 6 [Thaumetopoea pityocampa]QAV59286.1 NADH dehydrogenase subunit 6 [Thaumetopoea pityocampa]UNQ84546.1 NADH dehydrogenase subunit 6 [Thaumetopoea pityocampa]
MTKLFLSLLIMMLSFIMFSLNNPLSMGLMILTQTILICILSGMLIKTYWFSYILFLTFLGGLLVLFIYVSSIASNEFFNLSFKLKLTLLTLTIMILSIQIIYIKNLTWLNLSINSDMNILNNMIMYNNENKINLNKLYNNQTFMLMNMMVIYLFITLIAVVKITNIFYGPLRSSKF